MMDHPVLLSTTLIKKKEKEGILRMIGGLLTYAVLMLTHKLATHTLHQPIETMQANMTPEAFRGYLRGNIIKYTCRIGRKDGEGELKEAKKIQDYAKWLVESLEGKTINPREVGK